MNLEELELACASISHAMMHSTPLEEVLERRGLQHLSAFVRALLDEGQFYALLDIKRVELHLERAYEKTHAQEVEYLKDEVEDLLHRTRLLLLKMDRDQVLREDRDALLSPFLPKL